MFELHPHQVDAVKKLGTGKVLIGGTGSGKSITALAYYAQKASKRPIIAITTAKKRDSGEWYADAMKMSLRADFEVDSWNNIKKYENVSNAYFIFDEQRIVGKGAWVKSFWKIAEQNDWILLTATPADTWMDLMPVFVANGFYRNQTEFNNRHVRWARFSKYPRVDSYVDAWLLERYRDAIFVEMPLERHTTQHDHYVLVDFDKEDERRMYRDRWNIFEDQPIKDAGELMRLLRKSANSHQSRYEALLDICKREPRVIVYYNHNYELEILRCLHTELDRPVAEWNGHNHQDIPDTNEWVYLVQYQAGAEGWNCITTNQVVFYSLPYSYRNFKQAKGRIDRLNTQYTDLHYHIFKSQAIIDKAIWRALSRKKNFQASAFAKKSWPKESTRLN